MGEIQTKYVKTLMILLMFDSISHAARGAPFFIRVK